MLRPFNHRDRETFLKLAKEFYSSPACLHEVPVENFERTFIEILNDSPYTKGYIFEIDGNTAGYALLSFTYSNEAGGMVCLLEEAYVIPKYQNNGLGTELFKFVEEHFPHVRRFRLEVTDVNERARALYQRLGYEELRYVQMIKVFT